ncbi:hypothetical protein BDQ17DRAFT_386217 [Cyathus striatus]|nr:hypothetical protein BDQ17DRAFT_386217 [Cyathus striatus]
MIFAFTLLYLLCLAAAQTSLQPSTFPTASSTASTLTTSVGTSSSMSFNTSIPLSATPTSSAQFPTLSGYSACVTNCLQLGVANAGCSSVTDVNCFCGRQNFTAEVFPCIYSSCPSDLATAERLAQSFCALASSSISLSFPSSSSGLTSASFSTSSAFIASSTSSSAFTSSMSLDPTSSSSNAAARNMVVASTKAERFLIFVIVILNFYV